MSYPINYPTPQGANVQIFNASTDATIQVSFQSWVKPQGANMVWFTLIGAGGGGGGTDGTLNRAGGGSGAVTNFMIPAFLIPDNLRVFVGNGGYGGAATAAGDGGSGSQTQVDLTTSSVNLLKAEGGYGGGAGSGNGGTAMNANFFTAAGFFQSKSGSIGSVGDTPTGITFLAGGTVGGAQSGGYGYLNGNQAGNSGATGFFLTSPIIVGLGGSGSLTSSSAGKFKGGIGCGGGGTSSNSTVAYAGNPGGDGLAIIITW